jgi:hypothetical protein
MNEGSDVPEAELLEEGPDGEYRSPCRGIDDVEVCWSVFVELALPAQQTLELGKNRQE